MELLKQRILKDGHVKAGNVLKVDNFLNHQMDVALFAEIGKEFKRRFAGCSVTKIPVSYTHLPPASAPRFHPADAAPGRRS